MRALRLVAELGGLSLVVALSGCVSPPPPKPAEPPEQPIHAAPSTPVSSAPMPDVGTTAKQPAVRKDDKTGQ